MAQARCRLASAAVILLFAAAAGDSARAASEAEWIWSPAHEKTDAPAGDCFFRKTFRTSVCEHAEVQIAADDEYELYVNGRLVGSGDNWRVLDTHDITKLITSGPNTIAVKVTNAEAGSAGLVARVLVKPIGGTYSAFSTDSTWRTTIKKYQRWNTPTAGDVDWVAALSYGKLGMTLPWGNEVRSADGKGRFQVTRNFRVRWVAKPEQTGSLIAMTFNEFGQIIVSREGGGLFRITDTNKDGAYETVVPYCDLVQNCQGLLALNGRVFAVGDGPEGVALYRLEDTDRDGAADTADALVRFSGEATEHGAHAVELGPDGMLYLTVGNHTTAEDADPKTSPYRRTYEGDLVQPRYEDPGGHAVGVKAPGGTVIRTDIEGKRVEVVAGGFRNAYDLAFNDAGELFTYDSDMEWNQGLPWYRPTRVLHVQPGGEYGWRSGWAKWPAYFHDGLPMTADMGRGSPTGVVFYNHFMFPVRYHDAMFCCDWAQGQISVVRLDKEGGSYRGEPEVFLKGRPLNVTDIAVGPDGWLYFTTGGRGTEGGVYCVTWTGDVPDRVKDLGQGIERAIRQPQIRSPWGRQAVAALQDRLGDQWGPLLVDVARTRGRPANERVRALDLMQIFGPFPSQPLLVSLSADSDDVLRAKATQLMGIHRGPQTSTRLIQLLADSSPTVRRTACESLVRADVRAPLRTVLALMEDDDRRVVFAARRLLEATPVDTWRDVVQSDPRFYVFLHGSTALLTVEADRGTSLAIAARALRIIEGDVKIGDNPVGFVSDRDFTNLLRLVQLALHRGELTRDDVPELTARLAVEYPSNDRVINRELVRLLAHLGESSVTVRLATMLRSDVPDLEKMHIAVHAPRIAEGWSTADKVELLRFYEKARISQGGAGLAPNIDNVARDFFMHLTDEERKLVLSRATQWPSSAFAVLAGLPADAAPELLASIISVDREMSALDTEAAKKFQLAVIAVLGRSRSPEAMAYLREVYEANPERRVMVAIGLAQEPAGENWPLLVRALPILEGNAARLVLIKLATVDQAPEEAETLRQAILCGLRDPQKSAIAAAQLLAQWTGEEPDGEFETPADVLAAWQNWFIETYPDERPAVLPQITKSDRWTYAELVSFLASPDAAKGIASRGAATYEKAGCAKCHRYGARGANVGPDLTTVSRRFQQKEVLQAIVFPSHVISDQYISHNIVTTDGRTFSGIVTPQGEDHVVVTESSGEQTILAHDEIEEQTPSKVSVMPTGALNQLTLEEIADLFAYLGAPARTDVTSRRGDAPR
jgi:putative membrane-bound dehydrogenase-like protein